MTGDVPFSKDNQQTVILKIMNGSRPERSTDAAVTGFPDAIWQIAVDCWNELYKERPSILVVLGQLNQLTRHWDPLSSAVGSQLEGDNNSDGSSWFSDIGKLGSS